MAIHADGSAGRSSTGFKIATHWLEWEAGVALVDAIDDEEEYGLASVAWTGNARFQPEVLVLDGQDVSDECTVKGEWGSLDDLRIECDTDVGIDALD